VIIHTENLCKAYGQRDAVQGLNLSVPAGSAYALIGANGAGKTTTVRMLMNLIEPSGGEATVLGVDSRQLSRNQFSQIGFVSESQEMPARLKVGEYLDYLRPFYATWDRALESSILNGLKLPLEPRIGDLSHGMRMKLRLACALPFKPKLLVLDEPLSGIDPLVRDEVMERLLRQADEMTIFISSQELTDIEGTVTHLGFLENGRLLFQEPMSELSARVREVRITLADEAVRPPAAPADWINVNTSGNVLSFVDVHFSQDRLSGMIASLLRGVRNVDVQPIALRSIFIALTRSNQNREYGT
jgi:ABC-type multidrug transport system ATPase subunit